MTRLRVGTAVQIGQVRLVPIQRLEVYGFGSTGGYAGLRPVAVIVVSDRPMAVDMDGREVAVDELVSEIPELEAVLSNHGPAS